MSQWPSTKAKGVLNALFKMGWLRMSQKGSHLKLYHPEYGEYIWAFHDPDEIGPKMLARIAKHTHLRPEDL